ncbi:MAG: 2-amino-4-hydroxy-6-hydroxymethyldihydropteridine diphosphokinase [Kiritimatiellae bacterium]|nr:2-amino-4-hydroxy-6-hydroxymethyldihydropteridine diphosphokinase [Kiritimatiellia bacterium]
MPHTAIISIGSNLGDRRSWLTQATQALAALPETALKCCSSLYESEPVGVAAEHRHKTFLNAVLIVETGLTPQDFSNAIHQIEEQLLRVRATPNQPRSIDIDIIAFDNIISPDPNLTLPHPRAHLRRFVLQPLSEINPKFIIPGQTATVTMLLQALPEKPEVKRISGEL